ncbi:DM13 domain-containing protein [Tateyamaria sp.]|uniref:DM13 domain-containing protein n=1 Tax=Tateyamaria sp. TaxID=1929288 RepID=UPI00329B1390
MTLTRRQFTGLGIATAAAATLGVVPAFAGGEKRTGQLSGRKGYKVSGTVAVKKDGGTTKVVLQDDYLFDPSKNPPDIKIAFGDGETYAKGSHIHNKLTVKKGAATFEVPAGIDTDKYSELYIYCEQFTVILAVASLK